MSENYIIVFGGPSECSLESPFAPRRSFSLSRSTLAVDGFQPPPTLKQSFDITKPTTYTVVSKHTGAVLARLVGRAPGGIVREVVRAEDDRGIITLDLVFHADLSGHSSLALDSLRLHNETNLSSPVRLARVTLDPLRGFATEQILTHAPVSCFLEVRGQGFVAVSHPPWLFPGPHAWEASAFVWLDADGEVVGKLKAEGRCVPAGSPLWIGEDGPEAVGVVGLPVVLLSSDSEPQNAVILADPSTMCELARVVLPCKVPWLNSGAWIPPDDDGRWWESPVRSVWSEGESASERDVDVASLVGAEEEKGDGPEVSEAGSVDDEKRLGEHVHVDEVVGEGSVVAAAKEMNGDLDTEAEQGNLDTVEDGLGPVVEQDKDKETSPASVRTGWSAEDAPVGGI
jgi:hypothetical protein